MARKRQEVQLQQEIETQEEWEDMVSKEGVWVVDVYQEWCGPCVGMVANLRRLKNELGDDLLKFSIAKADTIDSLEKYRGKCEPCFMFYAGGVLVAIIRGANAPLILRTITEQLAYEHKVMEGTAERKEIKDTVVATLEKDKKEEGDEEEKEEDVKKEVTLCLIKPDAVQAGKAEDIKNELRQRGIEILREEERQLTEDEAKMIYGNLKDQTFYPELIKFMTSGPSHILIITKGKTGQNIIKEFRDIMGPTDVEEAKEKAPDSLRAKYGKDTMMNCLHGSSSEDMAERELAFFFPDFVAPTVEGKPKLQRTLALIRPDAFRLHKDAILQKIHEAGFSVAMQKELQLSKEQVEDFYSEHRGQPYFAELTTRMTSGPLLALGLAREDAVQGWRHMLGPHEVQKAKEEAPDSLRAQFSVDDTQLNQLHGSSSAADAEKELKFFFPVEQTVAVIKPDAYGTKEEIIEKIHEAGFRIAARKETKLTREMAEEFYADHKDKEYFNNLVEHMISGPTFFMILSREDAVQGWRELIGPTDPEKAKENPETLRAQYGKDVLQNAVHGSSNPDHAKESIKKIFEPVNVVREDSADVAPEYKKHEAEEQEGVDEHAEHQSADEDKENKEAQPETTDEPPSEAEASKEETKEKAKAETPQPPPEPEPVPEPEEKQEAHKDKASEAAAGESKKVDKEDEGGEESRKIEDEGADQQKEGGHEKNKEHHEGGQEKNKEHHEGGQEKNKEHHEGSGEAQPKVEDSKPDEPSEASAKPSSETEAKPSGETEAKPSGETEAKPSGETETKPASETETKPASETETKHEEQKG
ncbi:hypothetical protein ACJMK2_013244 [Sinanodonta woodiana]|uniref:Thioredoxin domain-containing protein n=1 Tax=Sinanodonta woodiana TaxID=1069815 RepID=A0ABD3UXW4_SINWO